LKRLDKTVHPTRSSIVSQIQVGHDLADGEMARQTVGESRRRRSNGLLRLEKIGERSCDADHTSLVPREKISRDAQASRAVASP